MLTKTSDPMIIAIRLCTRFIVSHNTKVYSGMCGQFHWLCIIFYFIPSISIFFSHIRQNLNPLDSDQSSTQTDIYLAIIKYIYIYMYVCRHSFPRKGVGQYNMMRTFGLHVRRGWILSFLYQSVFSITNCWNTQISIDMCTRLYWSKYSDAFDVTNLIWINRNEYFLFLMRNKNAKNRQFMNEWSIIKKTDRSGI